MMKMMADGAVPAHEAMKNMLSGKTTCQRHERHEKSQQRSKRNVSSEEKVATLDNRRLPASLNVYRRSYAKRIRWQMQYGIDAKSELAMLASPSRMNTADGAGGGDHAPGRQNAERLR